MVNMGVIRRRIAVTLKRRGTKKHFRLKQRRHRLMIGIIGAMEAEVAILKDTMETKRLSSMRA